MSLWVCWQQGSEGTASLTGVRALGLVLLLICTDVSYVLDGNCEVYESNCLDVSLGVGDSNPCEYLGNFLIKLYINFTVIFTIIPIFLSYPILYFIMARGILHGSQEFRLSSHISKILAMQCSYYFGTTIILLFLKLFVGLPVGPLYLFTVKHVGISSTYGVAGVLASTAGTCTSGLAMAWIVKRAKRAWDFAFTIVFIHIILTWIFDVCRRAGQQIAQLEPSHQQSASAQQAPLPHLQLHCTRAIAHTRYPILRHSHYD